MKSHHLSSPRSLMALLAALPFYGLGTAAHAQAPASVVPADSIIGRLGTGAQQMLLSPLETDSPVATGGWMLKNMATGAAPASAVPKWGQSAVLLSAQAEIAGGKGDFSVVGPVPGAVKALGMWVYLTPGSNVDRLGFQFYDNEGESFLAQTPADWQGWKWVEVDLQGAAPAQAWDQGDKNKKVDFPLKSVHVAWFSKAAGPTSLAIDALVSAVTLDAVPGAVKAEIIGLATGESNAPLAPQQVLFTNFGDQPTITTVEYSLQRDPVWYSTPLPDPRYGADRALGALSWSEAEGRRLEDGSLTDGKSWTNAELPWGSHSEATQTLDLGQERTVSHLSYDAADANWAWKIDFSSSLDGTTFTPVPGLQNVDTHGQWGHRDIPVPQGFKARFLRLRHHNGGAEVNKIVMPSSVSVYSGTGDDKQEFPVVGETIATGTLAQTVAPRSFTAANLVDNKPLSPGAYLLSLRVRDGEQSQMVVRHFMVKPAPLAAVSPASRFGLNTNNYQFAPWHRELGIGWVRFENLKWPMTSPRADFFNFQGVPPWNLNHDEIIGAFRAQNISVLPFLFQTPDYATSAPASITKNRDSYPPKDNAQMADFVFQTVARYGSKKRPATDLKTEDKLSGLGQMTTYEIWNEPNLNDAGWGPWVGNSTQYNALLRAAAEGAKRADPTARITNGGFAGIDISILNTLLAPYPDGKKPLDFVDTLNVHFYSGRTAPELSTNDPNADRSGKKEGVRSYEQDLQRMIDWRDKNKPGLPIWMSETGYDSAGPFGTNEEYQAAQLPRVIMLALAAGVEKVFVFRDSGSTPSMFAASGVIRDDGTLKPSYFTYATLIRELDGVKTGALCLPYPDPNVRLFAWTKGTQTILTAWTIEGKAEIKLNLGPSTVTDAFGAARQQNIAGTLAISAFPTYIKNIGDTAGLKTLIAQAQREATARKAEQTRLAKLTAYLFDFGSTDHVGTIDIGDTRSFTPVLGTQVFDQEKGYGFFPGPAAQDSDMHWVSDPLARDFTRMNPDHTFRFQAKPGRYQLQISLNPQGEAKCTIRGGVGGDQSFSIKRDGPIVSTEIEVGDEPISISNDGYGDMHWVTLIEKGGK